MTANSLVHMSINYKYDLNKLEITIFSSFCCCCCDYSFLSFVFCYVLLIFPVPQKRRKDKNVRFNFKHAFRLFLCSWVPLIQQWKNWTAFLQTELYFRFQVQPENSHKTCIVVNWTSCIFLKREWIFEFYFIRKQNKKINIPKPIDLLPLHEPQN